MSSEHADSRTFQAESGQDNPILDAGKLDSIKSLDPGGKAGLLRRVVLLFIEKSPPLLDQMNTALKNGDAKEVYLAAHSLKSSSAVVGALSLSETCRQLEMVGRQGSLTEAAELVRSVRTQFSEVCEALIRVTEGS